MSPCRHVATRSPGPGAVSREQAPKIGTPSTMQPGIRPIRCAI
jgi:hypothetical protein